MDSRVVPYGTLSSDATPDCGIQSVFQADNGTNSSLESDDEYLDELRKSMSNAVFEALCAETPRLVEISH